jgi:hypothetical protein
LPLQALAEEANHIFKLAVESMEARGDNGGGGGGGSSSSSSNTSVMVALARSQAAAAYSEADQISSAAASDLERMLRGIPKHVTDVVAGMVEAGQHGARSFHMPTLMAIRCVGKAGKLALKGTDLSFSYFCRCRLKAVDFSGCNLNAASFIDCDLTDVKMSSASNNQLTLDGSLLHGTDLDWITLLNKARVDLDEEVRLSVKGCSFKPFKLAPDSTISRVDLSCCLISDAVVPNIKLQNVTLRGAKLVRVRFISTPDPILSLH